MRLFTRHHPCQAPLLTQETEPWEPPLERVPQSRRELYRICGDPQVTYKFNGDAKVSRSFKRERLFTARNLPCGIRKLYVHRLFEPYLREALRRAELATDWRPKRVGCFAPRHQRHDTSRPLSDHTWACAVDIMDPDGHFYREGSTMPVEFIDAFRSAGLTWGGDWGWKDEMHFQLRKL